jgi:hypothetical protein
MSAAKGKVIKGEVRYGRGSVCMVAGTHAAAASNLAAAAALQSA